MIKKTDQKPEKSLSLHRDQGVKLAHFTTLGNFSASVCAPGGIAFFSFIMNWCPLQLDLLDKKSQSLGCCSCRAYSLGIIIHFI